MREAGERRLALGPDSAVHDGSRHAGRGTCFHERPLASSFVAPAI